MNVFEQSVAACGEGPLAATGIRILQVNVGLRCNQSCTHCHLGASPERTETMSRSVMADVVRAAVTARPLLVDVTGGAPELHPDIRLFIARLADTGQSVQVRTNLTALLEPGLADLPAFLRDHRVRLVGSMPCYLEENVDRQRGRGIYHKSVAALRLLNDVGYGISPEHPLDLVFNPGGAGLPPGQSALQEAYRRELRVRHGVEFTHLLTIANLPLGRFDDLLQREGRRVRYLDLLKDSFNPCTVPNLMCRTQVEVAWDGRLYDCDFNLALGLPVGAGAPDHVARFDPALLAARRIVTGSHCFGCTAGAGSSCRGALTAA